MRSAPNRSDSMPANGWLAPQIRFCRAMANAKVSRPHPWSTVTGWRNSPKVCRIPRENSRMTEPQIKATPALPHFVVAPWSDTIARSPSVGYGGLSLAVPGG